MPLSLFYFLIQALNPLPAPHLLLDPGHGGTNRGAPSLSASVYEKDLTLKMARTLQRKLQKRGLRVELTRTRDTYMTLRERAALARRRRPYCFMSLHFNASPLHNRRGIEIFHTHPQDAPSRELLSLLPQGPLRAIPNPAIPASSLVTRLRQSHSAHGSVLLAKRLGWRMLARGFHVERVLAGSYDVLEGTDTRAVLFEGGFLDHPDEGRLLLQETYRDQLTTQMTDILVKICRKPTR